MASVQEPVSQVRPGFEERNETANEPFERPAPTDAGGEHDFGSVAPSTLEAPTTVER